MIFEKTSLYMRLHRKITLEAIITLHNSGASFIVPLKCEDNALHWEK